MEKIKNTECYFSAIWVSPTNWKTTSTKASLKKTWYVQCYFYDPLFKEKYPKGFPFRKKLNKLQTLEERKAAVELYLKEIPKIFIEKGFNPITKKFMFDSAFEENKDLNPNTKFIEALELAQKSINVSDSFKSEMKNVMKYIFTSICQLRFNGLKISEVKRKHYRYIIDNLEKTEGPFSAHKFNKYRTFLQILYNELVEFEAVEHNIISDIRKRIQEKSIREVLTDHERFAVKKHLSKNHPEFWVFTELFFHLGGRISEMLRLQVKHVDLENQYYLTLIKKGRQNTWIKKPIKNIALPIFKNLIEGAKKDYFVFSVRLVPGPESIRREQINRRWKTHVKDKLGITSDFYALKHLNLDEVTMISSIEDAACLAGHTSTNMVRKVYAVGEKERQIERVKKLNNKFA